MAYGCLFSYVGRFVMSSTGVITALEIQKRNKERVNVFIDGEFAFGMSTIEAARLRKGQVLSATEIGLLRDEDAVIQAVPGFWPIGHAAHRKSAVIWKKRNYHRQS